MAVVEPSPHRMSKPFFHDEKTGLTVMDWEVSAAGYAAVWVPLTHTPR